MIIKKYNEQSVHYKPYLSEKTGVKRSGTRICNGEQGCRNRCIAAFIFSLVDIHTCVSYLMHTAPANRKTQLCVSTENARSCKAEDAIMRFYRKRETLQSGDAIMRFYQKPPNDTPALFNFFNPFDHTKNHLKKPLYRYIYFTYICGLIIAH